MTETLQLCWHITRRNWTVYKKDFLANISPTLADPAFFVLSLGVGLGSYIAELNGHTYLQFMSPGLAVSTAMMTSFFETSYGFYIRMEFENIFKAMLTTPIGVREVIIGEYIWVCLKGILMTIGVGLVLAGLGQIQTWATFPLLIPVGLLVAASCGSLGLLACTFVRNINQFQTVYSFLIAPLYFFSGIFFPLEQMPQAAQWLALALPLSHGVKLAQSVFWNQDIAHTFLIHGSILIAQSAFLCAWSYRRVYRKLQM